MRSVADDIASVETRGAAAIAEEHGPTHPGRSERRGDDARVSVEQRAATRLLIGTRSTAVSLPNAVRFERDQFPRVT